MEGVLRTVRIQEPYKLSSRTTRPEDTVIELGDSDIRIGGPEIIVMAGPCSVESRDQDYRNRPCGQGCRRQGAARRRVQAAHEPVRFPGSRSQRVLNIWPRRAKSTGLPIITEVMTVEAVPMVAEYADILQIGARNMQNYGLLQAVGKANKPVLLKRGMSGTIKEWLMCAEYIISSGNRNVMLCERGIRTYETATRNTFDLNAVPYVKQTQPSAGGRRSLPRHGIARTGAGHGQGLGRRGRRCADPRGSPRPGQRHQ